MFCDSHFAKNMLSLSYLYLGGIIFGGPWHQKSFEITCSNAVDATLFRHY